MIKELLANTGFIMYNKAIARRLGTNEAIVIGELCAKYQYWLTEGSLIANDGWFFITQKDIQEDTGLTPYQQRNAIQHLKDEGVLKTRLSGNPAKTYYQLSENMLHILLSRNFTSCYQETLQQDVKKLDTTNKDTNKDTNNILYIPSDVKHNSYQAIIGYLNSKAGTAYRAVSNRTKGFIDARMNEGYTIEDFKRVIDIKCSDWNHPPKRGEKDMRKYLRPETLFGTKFESYLNQQSDVPKDMTDLDGLF